MYLFRTNYVIASNHQGLASKQHLSSIIMRKIFAICTMLVLALSIYAQTAINGICYELDPVTKTAKVTYGGNYTGSVIIPPSVSNNGVDYEVTVIGEEAFKWCFELKSISIPNSIIAIENSAFFNCINLMYLALPVSVTNIGNYAFAYCQYMKSVVIPKSVTEIGYAAFAGCESLTSFSVDSENPVYKFENGMLLADDNTTLVAYLGDRSETKVTIPSTVKTIFNRAFLDCDWLTEVVMPNSVTTIGERAFYYCSALSDIELPNSVRRIEMFAFDYCESIESIDIKEGTEFVGLGAFSGCSKLASITFPSTATTIEDWVLKGCKRLQKIVVGDNNPTYDSRNGCNALIETSTNTLLYGCSNTVIPESVSVIDTMSFEGVGIKHLYIPSSVQSIGRYAFRGCFALESIEVDPANPNYDSRDNCNALIEKKSNTLIRGCVNTTIPSGVEHIGENAFDDLVGMETFTIPEGVKSIGIWAFSISDLAEITLPNTLEKIEYAAFYDCEHLSKIRIPDSVKDLEECAFEHCYDLTSIHIGNGVQVIKVSTFYDCSSLESIIIGSDVTSIDDRAFYRCNSLSDITILAKTPPQLVENSFPSYDATLRVPQGCKSSYESAPYWCNFATIVEFIPEDMEDIEITAIDLLEPTTRLDFVGRSINSKRGIQILQMPDGNNRKVYMSRF